LSPPPDTHKFKKLQRASGFTAVEVFRKYLWYALRERKFDADAVSDMVALKGALGLGDGEVAEALRERAQRIYDKYGASDVGGVGEGAFEMCWCLWRVWAGGRASACGR
jgi:hypothetical protein